ncbi:Transposase [Balamuthia mandrillaris]
MTSAPTLNLHILQILHKCTTMGGCIHGCRTQCCRTLSVQLPTFRHNDVLMCQETQKDVPGSMDVSVCFQATTGATEDLLPSQFLVDTSASSTGLGGVVLVHDLHPAVRVLPGLVQQAHAKAVVRPTQHGSGGLAWDTSPAPPEHHVAGIELGQQHQVVFLDQLEGHLLVYLVHQVANTFPQSGRCPSHAIALSGFDAWLAPSALEVVQIVANTIDASDIPCLRDPHNKYTSAAKPEGQEGEKKKKKKEEEEEEELTTMTTTTKPKEYKVRKIRLFPTSLQKAVLAKWFGASRWTYNQCLAGVKDGSVKRTMTALRKRYLNQKDVPDLPLWVLETPFDVRDEGMRDLVKAYASNLAKQRKQKKRLKFEVQFRSKKDPQESIVIHSKHWVGPGRFYPSIFKKCLKDEIADREEWKRKQKLLDDFRGRQGGLELMLTTFRYVK